LKLLENENSYKKYVLLAKHEEACGIVHREMLGVITSKSGM